MVKEVNDQEAGPGNRWGGLIGATSSPIRFFALTVLVCNSLFGVAAALAYEPEVFIYTLHVFLAVVGTFALIALWAPWSFYPPSDMPAIIALERQDSGNPIFTLIGRLVPTIVGLVAVITYAVYQSTR